MKSWPHAPSKQVDCPGRYIITAGTYLKEHLFAHPEELLILQRHLFEAAEEFKFHLQAWAIFPNHYHAVGFTEMDGLRQFAKALHGRTSLALNRLQNSPGRKVWYRCWDTHLTHETSHLARLNYVHQNAVRHGLVPLAREYAWCSAEWFEDNVDRSFFETVCSFPIDRVNVEDDF